MSDPHDPYEGTDTLAHALGATDAVFQQLREQLPDVPEHTLASWCSRCAPRRRAKASGRRSFRKRWYHMKVTARAFAEVLANPVPDDASAVIKDMLDIYHRPVDDPG